MFSIAAITARRAFTSIMRNHFHLLLWPYAGDDLPFLPVREVEGSQFVPLVELCLEDHSRRELRRRIQRALHRTHLREAGVAVEIAQQRLLDGIAADATPSRSRRRRRARRAASAFDETC